VVELDGPELPIMDGSAAPFLKLIDQAGRRTLDAPRRYIEILEPIEVVQGDKRAALLPNAGARPGPAVDFEIAFASRAIGRQRIALRVDEASFRRALAAARTFGFVHEVEALRARGLAQAGSLQNAVVVEGDRVLNPEGLRFEDEFVRHKLLDAIGDLALCGLPIYGRFRSYKGGHALNALVLQGLFASPANYEIVYAEDLPLGYDALNDMPDGLEVRPYLRSVG
jgi:UDP-3-O-[3-hydroxymyristoyl] N-acetylglucosamine deacetylase